MSFYKFINVVIIRNKPSDLSIFNKVFPSITINDNNVCLRFKVTKSN